jgi:hypothetical protein
MRAMSWERGRRLGSRTRKEPPQSGTRSFCVIFWKDLTLRMHLQEISNAHRENEVEYRRADKSFPEHPLHTT